VAFVNLTYHLPPNGSNLGTGYQVPSPATLSTRSAGTTEPPPCYWEIASP